MKQKDTGADPLPDGMFKMYPTGDIVTAKERFKRLPLPVGRKDYLIAGHTWEEIQNLQQKRKV